MIQRVKSFLFHNTTVKQTIVKNTFWLFIGQIFSRLIKLIIIVYAARVMGVSEWGTFSYVTSLAALFTVFMDFGINAVITRESSRDLSVQEKYFATALVIKVLMFVAIMVFVLGATPLFIKQGEVLELIPLVVIMLGIDGLRDFGATLSRAWEHMQVESMVQIVTNVSIVIFGFAALMIAKTAEALIWGYIAGTFIGFFAAFYPFRAYVRNAYRSFDKTLVKKIFMASWPFGMVAVMGVIMLNTDTVMVGWFGTIQDVGYYGAAQRVIQMIYLIPGLISIAFFPSMARLMDNKDRMKKILEKGLSLLTMLAVPLMVGGVVLAWEVVHILYGAQYLYGVMAFRILSLTFLPVFLSAMFGNAVFALNQERKLFTYVILGVVGNFAFNLLLIPFLGINGAALSTVINQIIITIYLMRVMRTEFHFRVWHQIGKIVAASAGMAVVLVILREMSVNVYAIVGAGLVVYFGFLFLFKEESLSEAWEKIKKALV